MLNKKPIQNKVYVLKFTLSGNIFSCTDFRSFWVTWMDGRIALGRGELFGVGEIVAWDDPEPVAVSYMSFLTGWGSTGEWEFFNITGVNTVFLCLSLVKLNSVTIIVLIVFYTTNKTVVLSSCKHDISKICSFT